MRGRLTVLTVAALGLAAPTAASAATVRVDSVTAQVQFRAFPWERTNLTITQSAAQAFTVADTGGPMLAMDGCDPALPVTCTGLDVDAHVGDRGSHARVVASDFNVALRGGLGADDLIASGQAATVSGGWGDDTIRLSSNGIGLGQGGDGNDRILSLGTSSRLQGHDGDDLLVPETTLGGTEDGGRGNDAIVPILDNTFSAGSITAGAGNDVVAFLGTRGGGWTINAGDGADTIAVSPGPDSVNAGTGNDLVLASGNGTGDTVTCGSGNDTVYADPQDAVASDCEHVLPGPAPANAAITDATTRAKALAALGF